MLDEARNYDFVKDMDPYVELRLGTKTFQTPVLHGEGPHPHWRYEREVVWEGEPTLRLTVKDLDWTTKDDVVGRATFNVSWLASREMWTGDLQLTYGEATMTNLLTGYGSGEKAGTLNIHVEWRKTYELLQKGKMCKAKTERLGSVDEVGQCAEAVKLAGGQFFAFGLGNFGNYCIISKTDSRACEEGWRDSSLDFYWLREEKAATGSDQCQRMTGGTCGFSACADADAAARGETDCIDRQCLCKEGFCWDGKVCRASCSTALSSELTPQQVKEVQESIAHLQNGQRTAKALALRNFTKLGESVSNYVDLVAQYLDFGLDWNYYFMFFGERFGGLVGTIFENAVSQVSSGIGTITGSYLAPYILTVVIGASCVNFPLACLAITPASQLAGQTMQAVSQAVIWPIAKNKKDRYDRETAFIRANATNAIKSMGECGSRYAAAVALQLADNFAHVRIQALDALEFMGEAAVPYAGEVALLLNDPEYSVRIKAKDALRVLGVEAGHRAAGDLGALIAVGSSTTEQTLALRSLAMLGGKGLQSDWSGTRAILNRVNQLMASDELKVRQAAAQVMAMVDAKSAAPFNETLHAILQNDEEDDFVKGFVAVALTTLGQAEAKIQEVFPDGVPRYVQAQTGKFTADAQINAAKAQANAKVALMKAKLQVAEVRAEKSEKALDTAEARARFAERSVERMDKLLAKEEERAEEAEQRAEKALHTPCKLRQNQSQPVPSSGTR